MLGRCKLHYSVKNPNSAVKTIPRIPRVSSISVIVTRRLALTFGLTSCLIVEMDSIVHIK